MGMQLFNDVFATSDSLAWEFSDIPSIQSGGGAQGLSISTFPTRNINELQKVSSFFDVIMGHTEALDVDVALNRIKTIVEGGQAKWWEEADVRHSAGRRSKDRSHR